MTHEDNTASQGVARAAGYVETGEKHVPPREGLAAGALPRVHAGLGVP